MTAVSRFFVSEFERYKFTAKEYDEETGLYYYGARYYDAKLSRWVSADPPLARGDYLPVPPVNDKAKERNSNLPGMGGVFNSINLDAYHYAGDNPVKMVDPDGNLTIVIHGTFANNADYTRQGSDFMTVVGQTFKEIAVAFQWSGGNSDDARAQAAQELYAFIQNYKFKKGESLNIVAHSHGGNVVKLYSQMDGARHIDTLVTLGTPQRDDYIASRIKIYDYINVFSEHDSVQKLGGQLPGSGDREDSVADVNLNVTDNTSDDWKQSHSDLHTPRVWQRISEVLQTLHPNKQK